MASSCVIGFGFAFGACQSDRWPVLVSKVRSFHPALKSYTLRYDTPSVAESKVFDWFECNGLDSL